MGKYSFVFHLDNDQKVTGSLIVSGGSGNDIDFSVADLRGNTILNLGRVSEEVQFEFAADQEDTYILHFDNSFSLQNSKTVILKYEIRSPFDPSILFIAVSIVVIILVSILLIRKKLKKGKIAQSQAKWKLAQPNLRGTENLTPKLPGDKILTPQELQFINYFNCNSSYKPQWGIGGWSMCLLLLFFD